MEKRKTVSISFRIDEEIKAEIEKIAKYENKTLANKAREILLYGASIRPHKLNTETIKNDIKRIDIELKGKLENWGLAIDSQLKAFKSNREFLSENRLLIEDLKKQNEKLINNLKHQKKKYNTQVLIFFTINILATFFFTWFFAH